jgi:class 3 adenylate cyclase
MFTDIVGYTQLMGDDEDKGFSVLNENRKIQHPIIQKFNGILHKELGDGILASFDTATNAVLCSKEIQDVCSRHSDFNLRIGIHLSEVHQEYRARHLQEGYLLLNRYIEIFKAEYHLRLNLYRKKT